MNTKTLFADLYFALCQKTKVLRDEKGELIVRLQQCEDQRKSLLFLVRSCATNFEENHFPQVAALLRRNISDLETDYAPQPVQPSGPLAGTATIGPQDEARSGTVSETAPQLESPPGLPVSHSSPGAYAGEWDAVTR